MTMVVADTSPLNYLIQIDEADLLQRLYGTIVISSEVFEELNHPGTPLPVKWIRQRPLWLEIRSVRSHPSLPDLLDLDIGERAAIQLAQAEPEALLLMDDAEGRKQTDRLGLLNIGTLGVLRLATVEGLVELRVVLDKLTRTNFRASGVLISQLIIEDEVRRREPQR
jgi:predicted nucleic acid-binding protein